MDAGTDSPSDGRPTVPAQPGGQPSPRESAVYAERLRTPWWWYVVGVFIAALLAAEFRVAGIKVTEWLPFGVLLPLAAAIVWWLGRSAVEVRGGELRVRGARTAHLPLTYVSGAVALDAPTLRRVVGREGDPAAFVSIRPWVGPGVQVWLDDDDDPTPYWVISTREPERLVAVLRAATA